MTTANYINLGNLMLEIKMYQKGIDYFMTALNMLKTSPIPLIEYNAYEGLADAYEKSGNYKEALKYRILYEHKKFDHINTERNAQISELEKKYETKNHELKIRDLEITDLKKSNIIEFQNYQLAIRNFWIVLFILGLVLLSFLFYLYYLA